MFAKSNSNELKLSRIYDAPVKAVWDAWTNPEQVASWWGPRGFSITTHSKDLRVGGNWSYTMHGPGGEDYPNKTLYLEVKEYSRLVYDHGGNDDRPALFRVTVDFTETKGKTKMEMTMSLPTAEAAKEAEKFIKKAGGNATWDRLAEFLEKNRSAKELFVINRSFQVPIDLMFSMWTDAKHVSQWLAPTGFNMSFIRSDIKEGGTSFYSMSNATTTIYGTIKYLEIHRPDRIVYKQQFCDKHENVSRHPGVPSWPETMLTTVIFAEEALNQTRVTVTWEVYGAFNEVEIATFKAEKPGMTQGWTGSFDKLDHYLLSLA